MVLCCTHKSSAIIIIGLCELEIFAGSKLMAHLKAYKYVDYQTSTMYKLNVCQDNFRKQF